MEAEELVTIICITYNQEKWIEETLESVKEQEYYYKELIIVDNGSTDGTVDRIKHWLSQNTSYLYVTTHFLEKTKPYCQLFNDYLIQAKGKYVVDLSGDDVLFPDHISKSVKELKSAPFAAFCFSDAYILNQINEISTFYPRNHAGELKEEILLTNIYETLVKRNFICSPTQVFHSEILKKNGGYDEELFYEDFDVQVRLARNYPLVFSDHIGVLKRKHAASMSEGQYKRYDSKMLPTTVKVCLKIEAMNQTAEENRALGERVMYELKHALWSANFDPARELADLGGRIGLKSLRFKWYRLWAKKRWDISWLYEKLT